jgi:hypothetical protein
MPKLVSSSSAGLIAFLLVACSSAAPALTVPPTAGPSQASVSSPVSVTTAPSPTTEPTPTAKPSATPAPSPTPPAPVPSTSTEGCPPVDQIEPASPFVSTHGSIGKFAVDLLVTRIEQRAGQPVSVTPPPRDLEYNSVGLVLGGRQFLISPEYYYEGYDPPITMEWATVTLSLDGAPPVVLPAQFVPGNENYNQVAVFVPDVAGHGRLALALAWTDRCFRLEASGSIRVGVVHASATAACELTEDAYWKQLESVLAHPFTVASREVRTMSPRNESKYAPYINPGIDAFIAYMFDKDDPAFAAPPGGSLRVEATNPALTLTDMSLAVFTRQSIAQAVKGYPPYGTVLVLERTPARQADGSWRLRVPEEPGRYVATMSFQFDSKCTSGEVWAVVNVDVTAPA